MQLALDALDRLVDTLEERGTLSAQEAARSLFATSSISAGLARSLLADLTAGDSRLACAGATVSLAGRGRTHPWVFATSAFISTPAVGRISACDWYRSWHGRRVAGCRSPQSYRGGEVG